MPLPTPRSRYIGLENRTYPTLAYYPVADTSLYRLESRRGESYSTEREQAAAEVVTGEEGGCVLRVRHGHVGEDALHDDVDGERVDGYSDDADDPVDVFVGGPT